MSFLTRYALHRPGSIAAPATDDRGARVCGDGASFTRNPATRRKYLERRAAFAAVEPNRN